MGLYLAAFLQPVPTKVWLLEHYISPFFKTFEGSLYVISFFSYLALAYRYLKFKEATIKDSGYAWEQHKVRWYKQVLRVLFLLGGLNTFYVITDFVAFNWLGFNMYNVPGYEALGYLSFAAMLGWLILQALHLALDAPYIRESRSLRTSNSATRWHELFWPEWEGQKWYLDPDVSRRHLCKRYAISRTVLHQFLQEHQTSFGALVKTKRLQEVQQLLEQQRFRHFSWSSVGFLAGYFSAQAFYQQFKEATGMSPKEYRNKPNASGTAAR